VGVRDGAKVNIRETMNKTISLDGVWQLRWNDGQRGDRLDRMNKGTAALERAWSARVPGSVHETLVDNGVIPEPNLGANVLACRWVEETIWYYRRTFRAPKLTRGERAWLVFESVDLAASVHLNGREVGRHANAFYPCRVEVTDALVAGWNTVVVQVESGLFHAMHRSAGGYNLSIDHELTKRPWLRKAQSEHGWDWAPRLLNVGLPGHVRLEIAKDARWDAGVVTSALGDDLKTGTVTARVFVEGLASKPVKTRLSVKVAGKRVTREVSIEPGMNRLELSVDVTAPRLWWPVGHGAPSRYRVDVELVGVGSMTRMIGFRHVRVNQEKHPESGTYFVLEINRKPIFCKGGNFVPADLIVSRIDRDRYATLVDRALESNFNMLRVWGGGLYESDAFYDLCDARGVMVWQEFIFACAKYPATNESFLADIKREATYQVRRLAHHPSLVVWCGNNEMEQGNYHWGYERGVAHPDYALFHMVLPRLVREEDGTRYYQPSSPFSPGCMSPIADDTGDQHPWSIGFGDGDFRKYREMTCRFPNEGGILGPTALPTVRDCADRVGAFSWELHDNSVSYWDWTAAYSPDRMIESWTGKRVGELSLEDYVYWGGLVQGAGLAEYVKNFRLRMFDSASAIFWMYNDVWPCTRSWTTVDYYLRRTPSFWAVKRAMVPLTVVVTRQGNRVRVYGVNDGEPVRGMLRFGLMALVGRYPVDETMSVEIPGNASTMLAEFDARRWDRLGIKSHVAFAGLEVGGAMVVRDALILPLFREMNWPRAKVNVRWRANKAVFTSGTFAFRVCVDLDGERPLTDNFFDVYPGMPVELDWPAQWGRPRVLRVGNEM
jgi:beta-mannosidase